MTAPEYELLHTRTVQHSHRPRNRPFPNRESNCHGFEPGNPFSIRLQLWMRTSRADGIRASEHRHARRKRALQGRCCYPRAACAALRSLELHPSQQLDASSAVLMTGCA
jgi:hypothetical protein